MQIRIASERGREREGKQIWKIIDDKGESSYANIWLYIDQEASLDLHGSFEEWRVAQRFFCQEQSFLVIRVARFQQSHALIHTA
jgi:hypothetical protein